MATKKAASPPGILRQLTVGELSQRAGVAGSAIHFYESKAHARRLTSTWLEGLRWRSLAVTAA